MMETKHEYIARVSLYPRSVLLRDCRAIGVTAHGIKTTEGIAAVLWQAKEALAKAEGKE